MTEHPKIKPSHLARTAVIYVRQSTLAQVERNTESTRRQYDLTGRAAGLGWPHSAIRLIDADQGVSGSVTGRRDGFEDLVAEVALGQVGIIIALEVSRLARDNAAWYRLLDLAGVCDTLVADTDTVYHPALFDDRLLLGMKGIMSEAELQVLRARLDGGIRSKAARGQLRRGLPVGLVYGEGDGQVLHHPDEQVQALIAAVFTQFEVLGSARAVWLWLKDQGMAWPMQRTLCIPGKIPEITWVTPAYPAVHSMLTHPAYAGARLTSGRCSCPATTRVTSAGRPTRPTSSGWPPTSAPAATSRAPALSAKAAPCCRAWRPAANAAANSPSTTKASTRPHPGTTAPAPASWSRAAAPATCGSAASPSTPPSPTHSLPRSSRTRCTPAWPPPSSWKPAMMRSSPSTAARPSRPATQQPGPNAVTARSTRRTGWWPAAWKPSGTPPSRSWPAPKPSSPAARPPARPRSPTPNGTRSWPWAMTCTRSGTRPPPPTKTASSYCAPCSARSASPCTATRPTAAPTSCCTGKAARSATYPYRLSASPTTGCAPASTPST